MVVVGDSPFEVAAAEAATPSIRRLWLRPLAEALPFRPGQYVQLRDSADALPPRSYSVANAPRPDDLLSLLVARVTGGTTSNWANDALAVGDEVLVSGPFGAFVDDPLATAPALYLAAGAGYAPVRALLEAALAAERRSSLALVFSARTEADVIDAGQIAAWQVRDPRFRSVRTLTGEEGRPPRGRVPEVLAGLLADLRVAPAASDVFIAGAPGFVQDCGAAVRALGARPAAVHTEAFVLEPQPWRDVVPGRGRGR